MLRIYFREVQRFNQFWIWLILAVVVGIWLWGIIQQVLLGEPFGNNPVSDLGLFLIGFIVLIPVVLIFSIKMVTEIRKDGIYYKMAPLMKFKHIKPDEIKSWMVRNYSPIREFGGWGIRFSMSNLGGKAINVKGRDGLQLELESGKRLLLGTQKPKDIEKAMTKMMGK